MTVRRFKRLSFRKVSPVHRRVTDFIPNMITVASLCTGLTAIRFTWHGLFEQAVIAIILAGILDGMDGRLARFFGSESDFGAELDSLSDFMCFGVTPAILLYASIFYTWGAVGWSICLFFATCTALRLARFNVHRIAATKISWGGQFSIGVPAPAGAFLGLLPLMAEFAFEVSLPVWFFGVSMMLSALLMISRIPTFVLKKVQFSRKHMASALLGVALVSAGFLSAPWGTLCIIGLAYSLSIPLTLIYVRQLKRPKVL